MTTALRILLMPRALFTFLACILLAASLSAATPVKAWQEPLSLPTWQIGPPQKHPAFREDANRIYPYPLQETLTNTKSRKQYTAVYLENEYVKVLVLPEIGGRLHGALDKSNNFEFFYWQKTIKPGLISMTGAWISGGIEWNFPHGHRPTCFMPTDFRIVHNNDGSATVWVGETESIFRMRWLVGMTLAPGRSYIKVDYVLVNPTPHRHSFQLWATAATYAGDSVQAQYPGDMVTGHGKLDFWNWPVHNNVDLTWWKNVPNASSFFAFNNPSAWFGTYDHAKQAGLVHIGNPHIALGKKLWTWGSGPSGRIWDDILSDGSGPYYEPQAGVWSDNQPDYHWLAPYEVKTTHDYWYPVRNLRGYHQANADFAANTDVRNGLAFAGVNSTGVFPNCKIVLKNTRTGQVLSSATASLSPGKPYSVELPSAGASVYDLHLAVLDAHGRLAIELQQQPPQKVDLPPGEKDPGDPKKMTLDELFHAGEWLDRFRRTDEALSYYREALARDAKDSRVNTELAFLDLKHGKWDTALAYLNTALQRDADNARLYYGRGLALAGQRKFKEAYAQFYRATWGNDHFAPAYLNLARLDLLERNDTAALAKLSGAARLNDKFAGIPALQASAHRRLGQHSLALAAAERAVSLDPMNFLGGYEKSLALANTGQDAAPWSAIWQGYMRGALQNYLELASEFAAAGLYSDAGAILDRFSAGRDPAQLSPLVSYFRGYLQELTGDKPAAAQSFAAARRASPTGVFPHRLEEQAALDAAIRAWPQDAMAHLFLGNLLYGSGQLDQGAAAWRRAAELQPNSPLALRNTAYALRHLSKDLPASYAAYQKAFAADPSDARILLELDQLAQLTNVPAAQRFALFSRYPATVNSRDDLIGTLVDLRLASGRPEDLRAAYDVLKNHHFHSWEGKYEIHYAWVEVNQLLGNAALARQDYQTALTHFKQAGEYPANLEVAARTPDFRAHILHDLARVQLAQRDQAAAQANWRAILAEKYNRPHLGHYYQALASKALGQSAHYSELLARLESSARQRTSGAFEHRGPSETIGHYLLALVLQEKGDASAANAARQKALQRDPHAARLALREAQIDFARAHQ